MDVEIIESTISDGSFIIFLNETDRLFRQVILKGEPHTWWILWTWPRNTMDQISHDDFVLLNVTIIVMAGVKMLKKHFKGKMQNKNYICFISLFLSLQIICGLWIVMNYLWPLNKMGLSINRHWASSSFRFKIIWKLFVVNEWDGIANHWTLGKVLLWI